MKAIAHIRTNAVAYLALFLAFGSGTAWAATQLPAGSVGAKQLKRNAVTAAKVKNGSLSQADLAPEALAAMSRGGQAGERGPVGPQGPEGTPGKDGALGPEGPRGDQGETGAQGARGETGPQGPAGPQGPEGPRGPQGPPASPASVEGWNQVGQTSAGAFFVMGTGEDPFRWANFSSVHNQAAFYKDPYGVVHLRGLVSCTGAGCPASGRIFTLPVGFRPPLSELHLAASHDGQKALPARINIDPDGAVSRSAELGGTDWISLDGITFRVGA